MKGFARWHGGFFRLWLLLSVFFVSFVRGLYKGFRTEARRARRVFKVLDASLGVLCELCGRGFMKGFARWARRVRRVF